MKTFVSGLFALLPFLGMQLTASAQPVARNSKPLPPLASPDVGKDHRITFRLRAPSAKKVFVCGEFGDKIAMASHEDGIWTATTEPAQPDLFTYHFSVDGTDLADPSNPLVEVSMSGPGSLALVPGTPPEVWEERDVPHGVVRQHWYESRLVGVRRNFFVYTPPGYTQGNAKYPVLYLIQGSGDTAEAWTRTGRAHVIYDNLIASGKAVPAIVVMPDGQYVKGTTTAPQQNILSLFTSELIQEVIPLVEREYRVSSSPKDRAIAGLSSGANQSAAVGLNHPEVFSQVGPFSGGNMFKDDVQERYARFLANPAASQKGLRLFWIAIGQDDRAVDVIKGFSGFLDQQQIKHTVTFTPGAHTWPVWRRNLREFAPLLFRP
jgi:enterochelin esterase family protein